MTISVMTEKGQIVIPSRIRRKLNIKSGTKIYIEVSGDEIILKPVASTYFENIAGILGTKGELSKVLLDERARDRERERS